MKSGIDGPTSRTATPPGDPRARIDASHRRATRWTPAPLDESRREERVVTQARRRRDQVEVDPRVDQHIGDVADQLDQQAEQAEGVEGREHHLIVAVDRRLVAEQAQPIQREDDFDQQGAGEQDADKRGRANAKLAELETKRRRGSAVSNDHGKAKRGRTASSKSRSI